MEKKICSKCDTLKILPEFYKDSKSKDGLSSVCRECKKIINRNYRESNADTYKKQQKKYRDSNFEKEKLTIKIPVEKAEKFGIRHLALKKEIEEVLIVLRGGVKKIKGMWSRRAQEYEEKINSGSIMLLAEVIRDLTRDIQDSDRSFSERLIFAGK
jgi:RNA polymerase-interacting CarD/CdnL/TRCF family regulator